MALLLNRVRVATATTGTGTLTLGAASPGFRGFAASGAVDGRRYSYTITEGNAWEVGEGVWTSAGNTLTRNLIESSTGALLNLTGSAVVFVSALAGDLAIGKQTIFIPAAAMVPRITAGPSDGIGESATNRVMRRTLDFDASVDEFAQFAIAMPKSWDEGTISFQPLWSHAATATNFGVVWRLAAVAHSDGDAIEATFGTAQSSADVGGTADTLYIGPESSAITVGNTPAELDQITLQISRAPLDAADTMAVDARLHGVRVHYTTNAGTDA